MTELELQMDEATDAVHVLPLNLAKDYDKHFRVVHIPFLTEDKFPGMHLVLCVSQRQCGGLHKYDGARKWQAN